MKKSKQGKKLSLNKETLKSVLGGRQPDFSGHCGTIVPTDIGCDLTGDGCTLPTWQP